MKSLTCMIFMLLVAAGSAYADVTLFLYPRVNQTARLTISQIAIIEGDPESLERIKDAGIDEEFITDGYIDREEVRRILQKCFSGAIVIYGNGIRISKQDAKSEKFSSPVSVKRGDAVRFQVVNSRIRIEVPGIALKDGAPGDVIPVRLKGSKVAGGTVLNERIVELEL